jgi:hypothetical protein
MAGNNYYMNYDPRWPSFHEEIYGTAHDHNRWNDFRSPPVYGPVEEPRNFGYEGSQYWRPHNYNGGYDGPLVPVGEVLNDQNHYLTEFSLRLWENGILSRAFEFSSYR